MKNIALFLSWCAMSAAGAILIPGPAIAQKTVSPDSVASGADTVRELREVVITATRVTRRIIDIPYPVVRLNQTTFQFDRKLSSGDLLSSVPGLFLQSRYGDHDVRFAIRGFGSRSNSGVRGVRILLDDIPESEPDGQTRLEAIDFNALGRIEIVKGNASSLYTNAPGGVVNFFNDLDFDRSSVIQFNQYGSSGLHKNGFKAAVKTDKYRLLTTYSYINYDGYRRHNTEYWHIVNMALETRPSVNTRLTLLGYFVDGAIKLPGSLSRDEFAADPWQANPKSLSRDEKRITTKGRLGIRYNAVFGEIKRPRFEMGNDIEVTGYGTIKYFDRTARDYRIINRYGLGLSLRYVNRLRIGSRHNEFSVGHEIYAQPARIEYYDNINGAKGDGINQIEKENIANRGFYISDNFEILKKKMFLLLTGRYDRITYHVAEETLPLRDDRLTYAAFTPKVALNYKLNPLTALYSSFGWSFDAPAANEMGSADPALLFNRDLDAQESKNFELGIKGNIFRWERPWLKKIKYELTFFNIRIGNEIIPYEVLGDVFYRNAANTNRMGVEFGVQTELLEGLTFDLTYTFSHFKYLSYQARTIELDTTGNFLESDRDFSGNIVPSVPRNNLYLSLSYARQVHRAVSIFARLSYQGISGMWVDDANTDRSDSYNLLNGLAGIDLRFGRFNVMLSGGVNNIFDEVYVGFTNTNSTDGRFYEAGTPRDLFLSLNLGYRF